MADIESKPTARAATAPQSFIVKFWLEAADRNEQSELWRGSITHVPSGERQYLLRPHDVIGFMAPYLKTMGITLDWRWRFWCWLGRKR